MNFIVLRFADNDRQNKFTNKKDNAGLASMSIITGDTPMVSLWH